MSPAPRRIIFLVPFLTAAVAVIGLILGVTGKPQVASAILPDVCFATPNGGATVYSSPDNTALQQAVEALAPTGGEVRIAGTCADVIGRAGTLQTVYISMPVALRGGYTTSDWNLPDPDANPTVLDALLNGRVIRATDALTVENIMLQHGSFAADGGGIYMNGGRPLQLTGVQILSSTAANRGGGVYVDSSATVANSRIENNQSTSSGGGLYVAHSVYMTGTQVISNTGSSGGGAQSGSATVVNSRIERNTSANTGGGLHVNGDLTMAGTHVLSNTAGDEGGGVYGASEVTVVGSHVENNVSTGRDGGGLYTGEGLELFDTLVISNTADERGGGIFAGDSAIVKNSRLEGNTSLSSGGGLFALKALSMDETQVVSNFATSGGGGVYVVQAATVANSSLQNNRSPNNGGGGLFAVTTLYMTGTRVISNTGYSGGGVLAGGVTHVINSRIERNRSTNTDGGGLWVNSSLAMTGTQVLSNTASSSGGGVRANSSAKVAGSRIENNRSTGSGGGLRVAGDLVMAGTHVISNTGSSGGGVYAGSVTVVNSLLARNNSQFAGGGLHIVGQVTMSGTDVLSNTSGGDGGGVYGGLGAQVTGSRFENNRSTNDDGGGLYISEALELSGTLILSNTSYQRGGGAFAFGAATVTNSRLEGNASIDYSGGGIYAQSTLAMVETQVVSNTAGLRGGGLLAGDAAQVINSYFERNRSETSHGGGLYAEATLAMVGTHVLSNTAKTSGGGAHILGAASVINSRFENNESTSGSGGGVYADASLAMTNTRLLGNRAKVAGGGISADDVAVLANTLLVSNTAQYGGGIEAAGSPLALLNSTLAGNHSLSPGGAISATISVTIANSILWLNTPDQVGGAPLTSARSIVQNGEAGGINQDPLFVRSPNQAAGDLGDLHLNELSPALDAGDDALVPSSLDTDLDGLDRIYDVQFLANNEANLVDMGAYERNSPLTPPTAGAGGPYTGVEGTPIPLDGGSSSGIRPVAAYFWDCTDNGSFDAATSAPVDSSCLYHDSGSFTLRLMVSDTVGMTGTATTTVTVSNALPSVTAASGQNAVEGGSQSFELGNFTDAGVDDGPWQVSVDWGDGKAPDDFAADAQGVLSSTHHIYAKSGGYTVTVEVADKDGGAGQATFPVTVTNVTPVVTAADDQRAAIGVGRTFQLGSFSDPGADKPWSITVDWGDATSHTTFKVNATGPLPTRPHTYTALGAVTVIVTVHDGDAGASDSFRVDVAETYTGSVEGVIYEDRNGNSQPDNGEGIAGASIALNEVTAAAFQNPVTTNAQGGFVFSDVPIGDYLLTVAASGYRSPQAIPVTVEEDTVTKVNPIAVVKAKTSLYLPTLRRSAQVQTGAASAQSGRNGLLLPAIVR